MFFILQIKYSQQLSSLSSLLLKQYVFHNYLLGIFINIWWIVIVKIKKSFYFYRNDFIVITIYN